ncbi:hypothetical protein M0R45_003842 [Rubus argutus]|uniref:SAC domain-containing protein n=1 Tax=Rubus argutus TaxID=59490 RepID=A0AAW1YII6_RUBAR
MTEEKAEAGQKLYTRMRLWEFPDQYVIEPTDGSNGSSLAVSRVDGSMSLIEKLPESSSVRVPKIRTIFGVVGVLKLLAGSYLLVITERECVGSYLGHPIYKVSSFKVYPCDHSLRNSPAEQKKMETEFSALLNIAERTPGLYFSYEANLTLSAQRLNDLGNESKLLPLWRQAEPRFLWNNYMLENLIDNKLDPYLLPIVQGSILMSFMLSAVSHVLSHHFQAAIGKDIIDVTLIARRCTRRNGSSASGRAAFSGFKKKYGAVLAVDLVNTHGGEGRLSEKFANAMQHIVSDDLRYWHFDFHHICGHIHFERLSILYEQIVDFLDRNGYLLLNEKGEKMKEQLGVVRTNCIDCLDRTNVTQSMIGRNISHPNLDECFKILWADHGDDVSIQYSGTPALKGIFGQCKESLRMESIPFYAIITITSVMELNRMQLTFCKDITLLLLHSHWLCHCFDWVLFCDFVIEAS